MSRAFPRNPTPEDEQSVLEAARLAVLGKPGLVSAGDGAAQWAWRLFDGEVARVLAADPDRRRVWLSDLTRTFEARCAAIEEDFGDQERKAARDIVRHWAIETDPFAIWRGNTHSSWDHLHLESWTTYRCAELLLRIDVATAAVVLEKAPHPGLVATVLAGEALRPEFESTLVDLIRHSLPVVDEGGAWSERRFVALLALHQLERHAFAKANDLAGKERLATTDLDRRAVREDHARWLAEALPRHVRSCCTALLRRQDGARLAIELGALLIRRRMGPSFVDIEPDFQRGKDELPEVAEVILGELAVGVVEAGVNAVAVTTAAVTAADAAAARRRADASTLIRSAKLPRKLVCTAGEGGRVLPGDGLPYLAFASSILPRGGPNEGDVWRMFVERLAGGDPSVNEQLRSAFPIDERFGAIMARMVDPAVVLRSAYLRLEPQRRRTSYGLRYEELGANEGSVLILRVGLRAVEEGLRGADPAARLSWAAVYMWIVQQALRLWLVRFIDVAHHAQQLLVSTLPIAPLVWADPTILRVETASILRSIRSSPEVLLAAILQLHESGISNDLLREVLIEAGLDEDALKLHAQQLLAAGFLEARACSSVNRALAVLAEAAEPATGLPARA